VFDLAWEGEPGCATVFTRLMMIESLWIVPLVLIVVVMLALGIFWVAEPRRSREDPQPRS